MKSIAYALIALSFVLFSGCKKDTPPPEGQTLTTEENKVEVNAAGTNVKVQGKEGSATVTTSGQGTEVKVESKGQTATVQAGEKGEKVQINSPGQPGGIRIEKAGGQVKVNVGGVNINVPAKTDEK